VSPKRLRPFEPVPLQPLVARRSSTLDDSQLTGRDRGACCDPAGRLLSFIRVCRTRLGLESFFLRRNACLNDVVRLGSTSFELDRRIFGLRGGLFCLPGLRRLAAVKLHIPSRPGEALRRLSCRTWTAIARSL